MNEYYLFMDESTTYNPGFTDPTFCLAGIIVKKDDYHLVKTAVDGLKAQIWHDLPNPEQIIFHEKDIREAQNLRNRLNPAKPEFHRFRSKPVSRTLYNGLSATFSTLPCKVIGAVIQTTQLDQHFQKSIQNDQYLMAMQIVLENFCQYLINNNGVGHVVFESRDAQDKVVRLRFNHIKAMGSMFLNPYAMQTLLKDIAFPLKSANESGLQLADFVPNPFARNALGLDQQKFNNYQALRRIRYDGGLQKYDRFGIKIMP